MDEKRNQNQIIRKDARNCFVESLNDAFSIGKAHLAFATYDISRPVGQRQTNNIHIYIVPFPVSWTVKMKKKQKETQDILSYHTQAAGCSDKARAKASGGRQPIEECGRTGL